MGCNQHRGSQPVEFAEQADQALADFRIDISRRFVGYQQIGPADHGARNGDALLFTAGKCRRLLR